MRLSFAKVAVAASTAVILAACAMPADDPNYNASAAAVDPADASAAAVSEEALASALAAPTSIGVDAPLPAAPAAGATIINLTTGSEFDTVFDTALDAAAQTLGWTVENVQVSLSDPTSAAAAFDEALAKKPAGIRIDGTFADSVLDGLTKAQAASVPVVCTGCSATAVGADVSIDGTDQNVTWGQAMATYVVTSSQTLGQSATVQVIPLPGGALSDYNTSFNDSLMSQCRECGATVSTLDPTMVDLTDPAGLPGVLELEGERPKLPIGDGALEPDPAVSDDLAALGVAGGGRHLELVAPDARRARQHPRRGEPEGAVAPRKEIAHEEGARAADPLHLRNGPLQDVVVGPAGLDA